MSLKKQGLSFFLLGILIAVTGYLVFRHQPLTQVLAVLRQMKPGYILLGLGLMLVYIGCEALCTKRILKRLGHRCSMLRCMGYSFVGCFVSSITPSASGGQPAQIWCMSRDKIPAAHGALNMMLIAICYQTVTMLYGAGVWIFMPSLRQALSGGFGLLLLYGAGMMILLTAGMLSLMFLPKVTGRVCETVLSVLVQLRVVKNPVAAQEKLESQLTQYAAGAACIRANPGLTLFLLGICFLQLTALFAVPYAVYLAFGLSNSSAAEVIGTQALLTLAVCNIPLPGAVGPAEGGFLAVFAPIFGAGLVTPAMLAARGISFYAVLLVSGIVSAVLCINLRKKHREETVIRLRREERGRVQAVKCYLNARAERERRQSPVHEKNGLI